VSTADVVVNPKEVLAEHLKRTLIYELLFLVARTKDLLQYTVRRQHQNVSRITSYSISRWVMEASSNSVAANTTLGVCINYHLQWVFGYFKQKPKFLRKQQADCGYCV